MKKIIIVIAIIIITLIGFGKYQQYQRFHSEDAQYKTEAVLDLNYHNQEMLMQYYEAVEGLNSYSTLQWHSDKIDVRKPTDDDAKTLAATAIYAKKLARLKYLEAKLEQSANLKAKGLSNQAIKALETEGVSLETLEERHQKKNIKAMFNPIRTIRLGERGALVYEVQKLLVKKGYDLPADGVFASKTAQALESFEAEQKLFPDGKLDMLSLEALLK